VPLGAVRPISVDVRLVVATGRDLQRLAHEGRFRPDLALRLCIFPVVIPPLRERRDDVPALIVHFLAGSAEARRKRIQPPTAPAMAALSAYDYPGNVRELASIVERAVYLADEGGAIDIVHLPEEIGGYPIGFTQRPRSE
jgi:DNA-binding NtrC family response regulator